MKSAVFITLAFVSCVTSLPIELGAEPKLLPSTEQLKTFKVETSHGFGLFLPIEANYPITVPSGFREGSLVESFQPSKGGVTFIHGPIVEYASESAPKAGGVPKGMKKIGGIPKSAKKVSGVTKGLKTPEVGKKEGVKLPGLEEVRKAGVEEEEAAGALAKPLDKRQFGYEGELYMPEEEESTDRMGPWWRYHRHRSWRRPYHPWWWRPNRPWWRQRHHRYV
ncbi:uncharacterized protein VTP21DRAFT_7085 [Calcarisporiella thermophila]|uniref:uncharacterized protein n=1 Tax=Calcarisporiella thermophila TaxID=911321 RepID=UPI003743418A